MKKTCGLMLLAFSLFTLKGFTQTEKGIINFGGTVDFSTTKSTTSISTTSSTFGIGPRVGYFILDNLNIGSSLSFRHTKANDFKTNQFSVAPFVRKYGSLSDAFKIFGQFSVPFSVRNEKISSSEYKFRSVGVNLSPGFAFFPTKKIALEFSFTGISYESSKSDSNISQPNEVKRNTFSIGTNSFAPIIGVQFHL
jgi:outer membrane protein